MKDSLKKNKNIIAIIPARGGSKSIKNKNIIDLNGKPLIYYTINQALKSNEFTKVIVSTDSLSIAKIAEKCYHGQKLRRVEVGYLYEENVKPPFSTIKSGYFRRHVMIWFITK